jgi:hypothetical protein
MHGRGTLTEKNGAKFEGEFFEGKKHGVGKSTTKDGDSYDTGYKKETKNGFLFWYDNAPKKRSLTVRNPQ